LFHEEGTGPKAVNEEGDWWTRKKDWAQSLDMFFTKAGLNLEGDRTTEIGLHPQNHDYSFTDVIHEAAHYFQHFAVGRQIEEAFTDIFGFMLCARMKGQLAGTAAAERFTYSFNASYTESVLCA